MGSRERRSLNEHHDKNSSDDVDFSPEVVVERPVRRSKGDMEEDAVVRI